MNNNDSKSRSVMNAIETILKNSGVENIRIVPIDEVPNVAVHQEPNDIDLSTCKEVEKAVPKNIPAITFDNSCVYTTDGYAEIPNDIRTIFCNMAYNNTKDIVGENNISTEGLSYNIPQVLVRCNEKKWKDITFKLDLEKAYY